MQTIRMLKDCLVTGIRKNLSIIVGREIIIRLHKNDVLRRTSDYPDKLAHEWVSNLLRN